MIDITKRPLAPVTDKAWDELRREAARALKSHLSARRLVDVDGPKGLDFAAVRLGRLDVPAKQDNPRLGYGIHRVLPLVEARARFALPLWELDNAERGARDLDLTKLNEAAEALANFEDTAVYRGFAPAGIGGLAQAVHGEPIGIGQDVADYSNAVSRALLTFHEREISGPFGLVLGPTAYRILNGTFPGYPPKKQIEELIQGPVVFSPLVEGGFLLSLRGGDFELTLGQDASLGYEAHDTHEVRLYLSESFTFRVLNPAAVVQFHQVL